MPMENSWSWPGHLLKPQEMPLRLCRAPEQMRCWDRSQPATTTRATWMLRGQCGIYRLVVCWTPPVFPCRWLFDPIRHHADRGGDAAALPGAGSGAAHAQGEHRSLENNKPLPLWGWYVLYFHLLFCCFLFFFFKYLRNTDNLSFIDESRQEMGFQQAGGVFLLPFLALVLNLARAQRPELHCPGAGCQNGGSLKIRAKLSPRLPMLSISPTEQQDGALASTLHLCVYQSSDLPTLLRHYITPMAQVSLLTCMFCCNSKLIVHSPE